MLFGAGLQKKFGSTIALDGACISVPPGRITVVIGPSGSGKTTLVRALAMIDPADSGTICLDGINYSFPHARHSTRLTPIPWPKLTVVFQQLFLWPHLTLRENILLALRRRMPVADRLTDMIDLFGMTDFIDRYPNEVSLGQRQRAALARAAILQPHYVLLDEITSALDVEQTSVILHYLLSLRDRGIGLLLVTHLLGFARRLVGRREGDQIAFMDRGKVIEMGGVEMLDYPKNERVRRFLSAVETIT